MIDMPLKSLIVSMFALQLGVVAAASAAEKLNEHWMDRVTAGVVATASAQSATFLARVRAEGMSAEASAGAGNDFARANGSAATVTTVSASASSSAETVGLPPPRPPTPSNTTNNVSPLEARVNVLRDRMNRLRAESRR